MCCEMLHCCCLQDVYQQARCWFGTGIAQQMQGEHEAALQSLESASSICTSQLQQDQDHQHTSSSDEGDTLQPQPQKDALQQKATDVQNNMQMPGTSDSADSVGSKGLHTDAVRGLCVKALLARASILRQSKRHQEADLCMQEAKQLDPAVGKYVKQ